MAPEQWQGEEDEHGKVDGRTDIYAFGVVLFEVLTGAPPFRGDVAELFKRHLEAVPPRLTSGRGQLPRGLEGVYQRCLAKRKRDRFGHVGELREALRAAVDEGASATVPTITIAPHPVRSAVPVPGEPSPHHCRSTLVPTEAASPVAARSAGIGAGRAGRGPSRLQIRYGPPERSCVLHVRTGVRASFGRQRRPVPGESWSTVPAFCLRYLPISEPAMRQQTDGTISRMHFEIALTPEGVAITDLSRGGAFVDGERLERGTPQPLGDGAQIRVAGGPLTLAATVFSDPGSGVVSAVMLSRIGNGEGHAYLLLSTAAPVGSAAGCAIKLAPAPGVAPRHAQLVTMSEGGVGLLAMGGPVTVDAAAHEAGSCIPLARDTAILIGGARLQVELHHPESDRALR